MADITATHSKGQDNWETPWWLVHMIEAEFGGIDLDPCCTFANRKGAEYYTEEHDGLSQPWFGTVFVNPPYSQMAKWAAKAHSEAALGRTRNIIFLCAARTDTRAWWDHIRYGEVRFIQGRLRFVDPSRNVLAGAPFPSALVIFSHNMWKTPTTMYWMIPKEARREKHETLSVQDL